MKEEKQREGRQRENSAKSLNEYSPSPIDVSDVELPEELLELTEQIARNVHEVWARSRMDEGWKYGPERDECSKMHPCLIAYESLPELEKMYDRRTAMDTLRLIVKLGFIIKKRDS